MADILISFLFKDCKKLVASYTSPIVVTPVLFTLFENILFIPSTTKGAVTA